MTSPSEISLKKLSREASVGSGTRQEVTITIPTVGTKVRIVRIGPRYTEEPRGGFQGRRATGIEEKMKARVGQIGTVRFVDRQPAAIYVVAQVVFPDEKDNFFFRESELEIVS